MLASSLWGSFNYLGFLVLSVCMTSWGQSGLRMQEIAFQSCQIFKMFPGEYTPRTPLMILSLQLQMAWSINVNTVAMALSFNFQIQDVV